MNTSPANTAAAMIRPMVGHVDACGKREQQIEGRPADTSGTGAQAEE